MGVDVYSNVDSYEDIDVNDRHEAVFCAACLGACI